MSLMCMCACLYERDRERIFVLGLNIPSKMRVNGKHKNDPTDKHKCLAYAIESIDNCILKTAAAVIAVHSILNTKILQ